jgi:hypothetical protein
LWASSCFDRVHPQIWLQKKHERQATFGEKHEIVRLAKPDTFFSLETGPLTNVGLPKAIDHPQNPPEMGRIETIPSHGRFIVGFSHQITWVFQQFLQGCFNLFSGKCGG